jgi:hypothetical protein
VAPRKGVQAPSACAPHANAIHFSALRRDSARREPIRSIIAGSVNLGAPHYASAQSRRKQQTQMAQMAQMDAGERATWPFVSHRFFICEI